MVNDFYFHLLAGAAIEEETQIAVSGVRAQLLDVVLQMLADFTAHVNDQTVNLA